MNPAYFRSLYQYNAALHRKVWESIDTLTDEQFLQPIDYSVGSLHSHMVHLMNVERRWVHLVKTGEQLSVMAHEDFPTKVSARAKWDEIETEILAFTDDLTQEMLDKEIELMFPSWHEPGKTVYVTHTAAQILGHVVNHATDHRAQILRILHDMGAPTFEQDWIIYLWDTEGETR